MTFGAFHRSDEVSSLYTFLMVERLVASRGFQRTVVGLIFLNALTIGLETYPAVHARFGGALHALDRIILALFTVELVLRFVASRPRAAFFRDPWHWFDLVVVAAGYVPGSQFMSVVRVFRVLRVLRAITVMPNLQKLVGALLRSLPSLGNILLLLAILLYVYGAAGTFLYGAIDADRFGTLDRSVLTLFEVITLEGWVDIMHGLRPHAPHCWIFFVTFILFGTFVSLNFFVGIIVGNMQQTGEEEGDLAHVKAALARIEERLNQGP